MLLNIQLKCGSEPGTGSTYFSRNHRLWGPRSISGTPSFLAGAALVITLFLSACGGGLSEESTGRSDDLPSADRVLAAARDAVSSVESYRSERRTVVKYQGDGREVAMGKIMLTWSAPDRIYLRSQGTQEGDGEGEFELIATDGRVFAKQSTTGNVWKEYEADPNGDNREVTGVLASARRFSAAPDFVPTMDEAELVGTEVVDGLSVYHVRGARSFKQEIPDENPDGIFDDMPLQLDESTYDLYVGTSDFLPRRLLTKTTLSWETSSGEASGLELVYVEHIDDFLDYNSPVTIELP